MRYELLENGIRVGMVSTNIDVQVVFSVDVCNVQRTEYEYAMRNNTIGLVVRTPRKANYDAKRTATHAVRDIAKRYQQAKANYALDLDMATANYADAILAEFSNVPGCGLIRTAACEEFHIAVEDNVHTINYSSDALVDPNAFSRSLFASLRDMKVVRTWN